MVGEWKRDEQSTTSKYRDWNLGEITHAPGEILIRFQYTSGAHRLEIDGVQILTGGNVIAADPHHGQTGLEDVGNVYRMKVPFALSGSQLVLRAKVRSDGGADSRGTIFLRWKGDHHALSEKH